MISSLIGTLDVLAGRVSTHPGDKIILDSEAAKYLNHKD